MNKSKISSNASAATHCAFGAKRCGKTTVARYLLDTIPGAVFSVSATTRPRRNGEVDGRDYHFLSRQQFERYIQEGELVEYEEIFGNYYGTLRSTTEEALRQGKS